MSSEGPEVLRIDFENGHCCAAREKKTTTVPDLLLPFWKT
jgi:hypothetical protein